LQGRPLLEQGVEVVGVDVHDAIRAEAVEVARRADAIHVVVDGRGNQRPGDGDGRAERAVAHAGLKVKPRSAVRAWNGQRKASQGEGEVGDTVAVEVARNDAGPQIGIVQWRQVRCAGVGGGGKRRERAVAVAGQQLPLGGAVGDHDIQLAVAVEVGQNRVKGWGGSGKGLVALKGAIAVAVEDGDAFDGIDGEVKLAVAIEIAGGKDGATRAGVLDAGQLIVEIALTEEYRDACAVRGEDIKDAIAVDIGDGSEVAGDAPAVDGQRNGVLLLPENVGKSGIGAIGNDLEDAVADLLDEIDMAVDIQVL
jgi:hypothetical protein